jgi:hypothetical protein
MLLFRVGVGIAMRAWVRRSPLIGDHFAPDYLLEH